jgi:hypothetical protein
MGNVVRVIPAALLFAGLVQAQPTESSVAPGGADRAATASHERVLVSHVPAEGSPSRADLERRFNGGKPIGARLTARQLEHGDLLFVIDDSVLVSRRTERGLQRYWLDGEVDRDVYGLVKEGSGYRKVTDRR